jgi:hypothetical protein
VDSTRKLILIAAGWSDQHQVGSACDRSQRLVDCRVRGEPERHRQVRAQRREPLVQRQHLLRHEAEGFAALDRYILRHAILAVERPVACDPAVPNLTLSARQN